MLKRFWSKWRRVSGGGTPEAYTDAAILHHVHQSLEAESHRRNQAVEQQFLSRVKERIALLAYISGEASLEDIRPYLKCEQCAHLLDVSREQFQRVCQPEAGPVFPPSQQSTTNGAPAWSLAAGRRLWFQMRMAWRPLAIGVAVCLFTLSASLVVLPWISPKANAILRFSGPAKPIVRERGRLADKVNQLLVQAQQTRYIAPSVEELKAMQEAAELVTLSLKLNNDTLLAEARKAADRAGYVAVEFEDETGRRTLVLQEKAGQPRGRGTFFFRRDHYDGQLLIVASHALWDDETGRLGFECFTHIPGADAFFLSGTPSVYIDEAHTENTIFNTVFRATIRPQAVCLSLHGFDENKTGREDYPKVVISSGAVTEPLVQRVHTVLFDEMAKFIPAGVYDGKRFADVAGTRDQQGILASSVNSLVVHLELSRAVRFNATSRNRLITVLEGVLGNVNPEIVARYAQPSRHTLVRFTTVAKVPMELLRKYGHNTVLVNRQQIKQLRLRSGDWVLVSRDERHAVAHVYPFDSPADLIHLSGAMRRRLGVPKIGHYNIQVSRLPE